MGNPHSLPDSSMIARGGGSIVKVTTNLQTGQQIAVKIIEREKLNEPNFFRELEALCHLNHPCVVRIVSWSPLDQSNRAEICTEFASNKSLDFVLERVGRADRPFFWNPTGKAILICGIVLGMRYVHSKGYIHQDLKPGNILINGEGRGLISDFGSVCCSSHDATLTSEEATLRYAAPELCHEHKERTGKVDVFSFGSILYEILTERPVFPLSLYPRPVLRLLLKGEMPIIPDLCGSRMQDLIHRCWSMNPESRPSFHSILSEFTSAEFDIVPGALAVRVREYVEEIRQWETEYCLGIDERSHHC
jgi:serine/threonine protein kinase